MLRAILTASLFVAAIPLAAQAQGTERYRLERTDNGFVRMDMQTGQMSFCEESSGELICRTASMDAGTESDHVKALNRRIDELERRIAALEDGDAGGGPSALPSDEEFEQTMSLMERFLRRFMGIVKDLESSEPADNEPVPERT